MKFCQQFVILFKSIFDRKYWIFLGEMLPKSCGSFQMKFCRQVVDLLGKKFGLEIIGCFVRKSWICLGEILNFFIYFIFFLIVLGIFLDAILSKNRKTF